MIEEVLKAIMIDLLSSKIEGLLIYSPTMTNTVIAFAVYLWVARLTKEK